MLCAAPAAPLSGAAERHSGTFQRDCRSRRLPGPGYSAKSKCSALSAAKRRKPRPQARCRYVNRSRATRTQCCRWGNDLRRRALVQLRLGQIAKEGFTLSLAFHVPQVGSGLVSQYLLAKSIEPALLAIVAGVRFHQFHPLSMGGSGGSLPFRYYQSCESVFCPLNASFLKEIQRIQLPTTATTGNDKKRPAGHRPAGRNDA